MADALHLATKQIESSAGRRRGINWSAYLYVLPALLLFLLFVLYPVVYNVALSLHSWNGLAPDWKPVGVANFIEMVQDRIVRISVRNSGIFVLGHLVTMSLGLMLAVFLNHPYPGRNIARTLIFLPGVLASTIIAVTWSTIYETNLGAINRLLRQIGLGILAQDWLGNPNLAIWSVILVGVWTGVGFSMTVYLASLQSITVDIHDAAQIDGANRRQIFWYITLPLLRKTHLVLLMLGVIASVQAFDVPSVLTGGGPYGATTTLTIHVYKNVFSFSRFGYGAALSQFTLVLLIILTLLQRTFLRERELS